jgi:tRNA A37 methylthiotransferase MiaB
MEVIERLRQVLADDAQIVLNSCYSSSDEDNIARRISELFNTTVVGPTVATGIGDIRVKFNRQDKPKIIVDYAEGDHVRRYFRANKEEK